MNRRTILKASGLGLIGLQINPLLKSVFMAGKKLEDIGIQLYTVRDDMKKDAVGTLRTIAEIGYTHIECAGYSNGKFYGLQPLQFKNILKALNLTMHSGHTMTGYNQPAGTYSMTNNWEKYCEDAAYMGQKYIVSAYFHEGERKTLDDYRRHAALFNTCAETAKEYGLVFCHHNHDFEFLPIDNVIPNDILIGETDPKLVFFELDHYWTTKANYDVFALFAKHPGRFPLFHIKDMDKTPEKFFTEVGSGTIDWKKVFDATELAGMKHFYVEQDACKNYTPLESIDKSYQYLKDLSY